MGWVLALRSGRASLASAAPAAVVLLPPAWTRFEPVVLVATATRAVYRLVLYDVPVAAAYRGHEIGPWTTYWKVQRFQDMWKRRDERPAPSNRGAHTSRTSRFSLALSSADRWPGKTVRTVTGVTTFVKRGPGRLAVSYTHLTLPTICSV